MRMCVCLLVFAIAVSYVFQMSSSSMDQEAKGALIRFLNNLSSYDGEIMSKNGWLEASDPCVGSWRGVVCENNSSVTKLLLDGTGLSGILDVNLLCNASMISRTLSVLSLNGNKIAGMVSSGISMCHQLTDLNFGRNRLCGYIPNSIGSLKNLKRLDISYNSFIGNLPDLSQIKGLNMLAVEVNRLSGRIPELDFSSLSYFNVSYNNFSGVIPGDASNLNQSSFQGNPFLCGHPLKKTCPKARQGVGRAHLFMFAGCTVMSLVLFAFSFVKLYNLQPSQNENKVMTVNDESENKHSSSWVGGSTIDVKTEVTRPETSAGQVAANQVESTSDRSDPASQLNSLVVLSNAAGSSMTFNELMMAPAQLLGRGKHAHLYRVEFGNGVVYAVKRIRKWGFSHGDFAERIQRIGRANHPNVLPVVAFYSSKQEKLLVYEYQQHGSLLGLLQGKNEARGLEWGFRLDIAAKTADALAHLHRELQEYRIGHGNLKSSNIILNKDMEPCISEYGLGEMSDHNSWSYPSSLSFLQGLRPDQRSTAENDPSADAFQCDVYNFGLILLELLTGKTVQCNGSFSLTKWVNSVVREEWTVEVFDKWLVSEGASEERMVYLLQVALKCVNKSPEGRPTSARVADMIHGIKEEEERASSSSTPYDP
ncbi:hypothetical protein MLD38_013198 [Melastoma candidum]|uniref:Uncharacterized protein n=1 Tax=Melastoma candidum TaxID=119954 RepID=A0ACB9R8X3_9MYRT|nr:hypothetical protein MLD38_013198 [Melastoma candidum]